MPRARWTRAFVVFCVATLSSLSGQQTGPDSASRIHLTFNTDEADSVLAIMDKRAAGTPVADSDWQRLFATEPYTRLKKREAGLHRDFTDDDFKTFVLSPELAAKHPGTPLATKWP